MALDFFIEKFLKKLSSLFFILLFSFGIPLKSFSKSDGYSDKSHSDTTERLYIIGSSSESFLTPGSSQFVSKEELQKFHFSNVHQVLGKIGGVNIQTEDGFGLRPNIGLRGALPHRSQKITLLEDGVVIAPAPYSAPAAYFFPNILRMSAVEIFKGPSALKYGPHSIGGAINFVTTPITKKKHHFEFGLSQGLVGTLKALASMRIEKGGAYLIEYNQMKSNGFKDIKSDHDPFQFKESSSLNSIFPFIPQKNNRSTGVSKNDLLFKSEHDFKLKNQKLAYTISYSNEVSFETYLGLTSSDFEKEPFSRYAATQNDVMDWKHSQHQFRYSLSPLEDWDVNFTLYFHKFERSWTKFNGFNSDTHILDFFNPSDFANKEHYIKVLRGEEDSNREDGTDLLNLSTSRRFYRSRGANISTSYLFSPFSNVESKLSLRFQYHFDSMEKKDKKGFFAMKATTLIREEEDKAKTEIKDSAEAYGFFLEEELDFFNKFILTGGLRADFVQMKRDILSEDDPDLNRSYTLFSPGVGLQYLPIENVNIIMGFYKGTSTPTPGRSENEKAEESFNYEAGIKFKGLFEAEVIGFFSDYKNIKELCSVSQGCDEGDLSLVGSSSGFNQGEAYIYGIESHLKKEFRFLKTSFPIEVSYTKTKAYFIDEIESTSRSWGYGRIKKGDSLPYISEDKVSLSSGIKFKRHFHFLSVGLKGEMFDQSVKEGRKRIPSFWVVDWISKIRISKGGEIFFRVDNLLGKTYLASWRPFGARPGQPRSLNFGLKYIF